MDKNITISPAEWEVMRIVWTLGEAGSTQIINILQHKKKWTESTIKTLLRRQVQKGFLKAIRKGRRFIYSATIDETTMMNIAATTFFNNLCNMKKGHLLVELTKQTLMSKTDINDLQKVLQQKKITAPTTVPCNCIPDKCLQCSITNENKEEKS